jgi:hypothetical protein
VVVVLSRQLRVEPLARSCLLTALALHADFVFAIGGPVAHLEGSLCQTLLAFTLTLPVLHRPLMIEPILVTIGVFECLGMEEFHVVGVLLSGTLHSAGMLGVDADLLPTAVIHTVEQLPQGLDEIEAAVAVTAA